MIFDPLFSDSYAASTHFVPPMRRAGHRNNHQSQPPEPTCTVQYGTSNLQYCHGTHAPLQRPQRRSPTVRTVRNRLSAALGSLLRAFLVAPVKLTLQYCNTDQAAMLPTSDTLQSLQYSYTCAVCVSHTYRTCTVQYTYTYPCQHVLCSVKSSYYT